jgi:hypothetical protein
MKGGPTMLKYLVVSGLLLMSPQAKADDGFTLLKECTAFVKGDSVSEEKGGLKLWAGCRLNRHDRFALLFEHVAAPSMIAPCGAAKGYEHVKPLQRSARRYKPPFLKIKRSVDCALGRDHCRQFVVGLI